jgi:CBS domain-containing protein
MPIVEQRSVLTGLQVKDAMRRNVQRMAADATLAACIRRMIKYKGGALLVDAPAGKPAGVVSRTDLMGAYYAGLPLEAALQDILAGPPRFCYPDDGLEDALDLMRQAGIHRLYVRGAGSAEAAGVIGFADIVGLIYRYCRFCAQSRRKAKRPDAAIGRLTVREVMSPLAASCNAGDPIELVIETLSTHHFGAVLIAGAQAEPVGVVSKADLMLAYLHGVPTSAGADSVMTAPVAACSSTALLSEAIQQMLLKDVQRLFVTAADGPAVIGVLSLSDAARFRSGTCKACGASRVLGELPGACR